MKFLEKNLSIKNILNINEHMTKIECLNKVIINFNKINIEDIREYNELILLNSELSKTYEINNDIKYISDEINYLKKYIKILKNLEVYINKSKNLKFISSVDKIENYIDFFEKNHINIMCFNNMYKENDNSLQKTIDKALKSYDKESILTWLKNIKVNYNELTNDDLLAIKKINTTNELLNEFSTRIKNNEIELKNLIHLKDVLFFEKNIDNLINLENKEFNTIITNIFELDAIFQNCTHDKNKILYLFNESKLYILINKAIEFKNKNLFVSIINSIYNKIDENDLLKNKIEYNNLINLFLTSIVNLVADENFLNSPNNVSFIDVVIKFYSQHIENLEFDKKCEFIDKVLSKKFIMTALKQDTTANKMLFQFIRPYENNEFTTHIINRVLSFRDDFNDGGNEYTEKMINKIFNTINSVSLHNNYYNIITPDYIEKLPQWSLFHYSELLLLKLNNLNNQDENKGIRLKKYIESIVNHNFDNLIFLKLNEKSNILKYKVKMNNIIQFIFLRNDYDMNFITNEFLLDIIEKNKVRDLELILNSFTNENKVLTVDEYYDYIKNYTYYEKEIMLNKKIEMEDFYNSNHININMKKLFTETKMSNLFSSKMTHENDFLKFFNLTKNVHDYNFNFFKEQLESFDNYKKFNKLKIELEKLELLKLNKNNNKKSVKKI